MTLLRVAAFACLASCAAVAKADSTTTINFSVTTASDSYYGYVTVDTDAFDADLEANSGTTAILTSYEVFDGDVFNDGPAQPGESITLGYYGDYFYLSLADDGYLDDPEAGCLTTAGCTLTTGQTFDGEPAVASYSITTTPEPGSLALFGTAALGLWGMRKRLPAVNNR